MKNTYYILFTILILGLTSCSSYKKMTTQNNNEIAEIKSKNSSIDQEKVVVDEKVKKQQSNKDILESKLENLSSENIALDKKLDSLRKISDKEIIVVTTLFINYLNTVSNICKTSPPPCVNAANGWMREYIAGGNVNKLANQKIDNLTSADGIKLMNLYSFFATNNQNAFISNPNAEDKNALPKMFQDALRLYNIYNLLAEDIARLYLSDGSDLSAWKKSKEDSDKLLNELKANRNVCRRGRHANGWIADWVNTSSGKSLELLNKTNFYSGTPKILKVKGVLSLLFAELLNLQTNSQCKDCPFLPAEWQIGYGLMLKTAADKLTEVIKD